MAFVQTRTIVKKNLQNAQFRKRKHIFLVLNIRPSLRGWGVEILEVRSFSPFVVCMLSNSCAYCQKIKFLPLKVDHVFALEEAVALQAHRSAVSYINEKEGHVILRELSTRL